MADHQRRAHLRGFEHLQGDAQYCCGVVAGGDVDEGRERSEQKLGVSAVEFEGATEQCGFVAPGVQALNATLVGQLGLSSQAAR
jgi:hypothetical protein